MPAAERNYVAEATRRRQRILRGRILIYFMQGKESSRQGE